MAMNWLQNGNDGAQQLPVWLQAIIKGGAAGGSMPDGQNAPIASAPAPATAPQDAQAAPQGAPAPSANPPAQTPAAGGPAPSPSLEALHLAEHPQYVQPGDEPAPVPSLNVPGQQQNIPNWLTDVPQAQAKAPFSPSDQPLQYQAAPEEHAQVPGRPRGPFDKIPDGEPGSDAWGNRHNKLREALALLGAGAAEFGGRDPWGTNGHPGEGMALLQPWLASKQAQRTYDANLPAIQQQADVGLKEKQAEIAQKNAAANSQFVFDPSSGRYIPVKIAVAQTAAQPKMAGLGLNPDGTPKTADQLSLQQNEKLKLDAAHAEFFEARQNQADAKAELDRAANDPNSALYHIKLAQYQLAQKRFGLAQERVGLAYRNFGVNTYGVDFGNNSSLQSGAAPGAPGVGGSPAPGTGPAPAGGTPKGVPQGNDGQPLIPNGKAIVAARQSMASGQDHQSVLAFNTAAGHLSQLQDAITALNNGDIKALNSIANHYGVQTGQSAPVVFEAIRNAVSGELGKVFKGQVTDSEIQNIGETLGRDLGSDALTGVVKSDAHLMLSKLVATHDSYFGLTGEHPYVLFPETVKAFQKLGIELPSWASAASQPTNRTKQAQAPAVGPENNSSLPTYDINGKRIK